MLGKDKIVAIVLTALVLALFEFFKNKADKKLFDENAKSVRTRPPKLLSGFLLSFSAFFFAIDTALFVNCFHDSSYLGGAIFTGVMVLLAFSLYVWLRFNYVIADDERIVVFKPFRKKKCYHYYEIAYFKYTGGGMEDSLKCYNSDKKRIFYLESIQVGVSIVVQKLREHEVEEI